MLKFVIKLKCEHLFVLWAYYIGKIWKSQSNSVVSSLHQKRKPQEKTTYKKIQEWIEENYGFKVHTAYVAEVKRELGLPMYDAPNAVDELKRPRQHPTEQMTTAIKAALKHFEII